MKTKPCRRRPHSAPRSRRASNIRRPRFESLEDRRLLTVLFSENFPATSFSGANWSTIDDATIDSVGLGEPSSPYSARLNGNPDGGDRMESAVLNLSGQSSATLSYYYQRTGGGNGTETGDDLILEYKNSVGSWVELDRQPGSGADMSSYALRTVSLPSAALHSAFQFRRHWRRRARGGGGWRRGNRKRCPLSWHVQLGIRAGYVQPGVRVFGSGEDELFAAVVLGVFPIGNAVRRIRIG